MANPFPNDPGQARTFGEGCDARIAGFSKTHNPHNSGSKEYIHWRRGWEDVNRYWGKDAKWPVITLPEV